MEDEHGGLRFVEVLVVRLAPLAVVFAVAGVVGRGEAERIVDRRVLENPAEESDRLGSGDVARLEVGAQARGDELVAVRDRVVLDTWSG